MDSWASQIARPLGAEAPWAWAFIIFFLVIVGLGFLNLLSAIFVDSLLEMNKSGLASERQARQEAQLKAMENIGRLFAMIDADASGSIDSIELATACEKLEQPEWKPILSELGVSPASLETLLREFNEDDASAEELFYDDFIDMFVHLDETATKKECYKIEKQLSKVQRNSDQQLKSLRSAIDVNTKLLISVQKEMGKQREMLQKLLDE